MAADRERPEVFDLSLLRNRVLAVREAIQTLEESGPQSEHEFLLEIRKQQAALQEVSDKLWDVATVVDEGNANSGDVTIDGINAIAEISKDVADLRLKMIQMVVQKRLDVLKTGRNN